MNLLVLGSQGFIGSHLVTYFISKGHTVTGCDLVENAVTGYNYQKISILSSDFDTLFSEEKFDVCINASGSGNVSYSISHPLSDFEANTLAVSKVLDTIRKYRPSCKYVHISSAAVYGNPVQLPIRETDLLTPLSPYGFHKWMSEILCKEYYQLYHLPIAVIRPFSVYGNGLKKQLLWDISQKLYNNDSISLFGSGKETRDFIHISDLVILVTRIIENSPFQGDVYNAAAGKENSIKEVADIFVSYYKRRKTILFSGTVRSGDPLNWRADISKAGLIGFVPQMELEKGIREYLLWFEFMKSNPSE